MNTYLSTHKKKTQTHSNALSFPKFLGYTYFISILAIVFFEEQEDSRSTGGSVRFKEHYNPT